MLFEPATLRFSDHISSVGSHSLQRRTLLAFSFLEHQHSIFIEWILKFTRDLDRFVQPLSNFVAYRISNTNAFI